MSQEFHEGDLVSYQRPAWGWSTGRVILVGSAVITAGEQAVAAALVQDLSENGAREYWPLSMSWLKSPPERQASRPKQLSPARYSRQSTRLLGPAHAACPGLDLDLATTAA